MNCPNTLRRRAKVFFWGLCRSSYFADIFKFLFLFFVLPAVVSANIISRGNRSRGYGFVEMATLAEAEKAVELMNKVEVSGRPIKVEVAKPREESAEGSSSGGK